MAHLRNGNFRKGWQDYESHLKLSNFSRYRDIPVWDGQPLINKRLLIFGEQGLGTNIQFARLIKQINAQASHIVFSCSRELKELFSRMLPEIEVVCEIENPEQFDFQISLLSLPRVLDLQLPDLPGQIPYLHADYSLTKRFNALLPNSNRLKVAIYWQGNPRYGGDRFRSIPLKHFASIAQRDDIDFVSIQCVHGLSQLPNVRGLFPLLDLSSHLYSLNDVAAVMASMDLVIGSDTSLAHLAGAMGRPIWLLLNQAADWRWLLNRSDSPWYPTMRIFRQQKLGDWMSVFSHVNQQLDELERERHG